MINKKPLIEDLSADYVSRHFSGALFRIGDSVHKLLQCSRHDVHVLTVNLNNNNPAFREILPARVLEDFSSFKIPSLGYRQGDTLDAVRYLISARSTMRGFRLELISQEETNLITFPESGTHISEIAFEQAVRLIYVPAYVSIQTAISLLLNGEASALAINKDTAIGLSKTGTDHSPFDVLFKGVKVGSISDEGEITLTNKVARRSRLNGALAN